MAAKHFGTEEALGAVLTFDLGGEERDFQVVGVVEDVPRNAHFHFDFLLPFSLAADQSNRMDNWVTNWLYTYVLLDKEASTDQLEAKLPAFFEAHVADFPFTYAIQPITDIHLNPLWAELEPQGSREYVYTFLAIAIFILLVACINFINLVTARSAERGSEVGLRKTLGAHRTQLVAQFLGESLLLSVIAGTLVIVLIELALPLFNMLSGKAIEIDYFGNPLVLGGLAVFILFVGLLAGSYPAFFLARYQPLSVMKGGTKHVGTARLRKMMVVFQFSLTVVLIIGTGVVYNQLSFLKNKTLGFDEERMLVMDLPRTAGQSPATIVDVLEANPNVVRVSLNSGIPGRGVSDYMYVPEGMAEEDPDVPFWQTYFVDENYVETLGLELVAGRGFDERFSGNTEGFLLNETAAHQAASLLGPNWQSALSKELAAYQPGREGWREYKRGPVIGVVKDFHYSSLRVEIGPLVLHMEPRAFNTILIRLAPGEAEQTLASIEETWQQLFPSQPFAYTFLDAELETLYQSEQSMGQLGNFFSMLAILIACLGLLGLVAFSAERRTKEIGIRKVLGASATNIVLLLSKEYLRLVLLAIVLAVPIAYVIMNRWLDDFAYRIDMPVSVILLSGALAFIIALATLSYQAIKAALGNPVNALRAE